MFCQKKMTKRQENRRKPGSSSCSSFGIIYFEPKSSSDSSNSTLGSLPGLMLIRHTVCLTELGKLKFVRMVGSVLCLSQFLILPQPPQKTKLTSKGDKIDSKIIIALHQSKSVTHYVGLLRLRSQPDLCYIATYCYMHFLLCAASLKCLYWFGQRTLVFPKHNATRIQPVTRVKIQKLAY